MRKRRVLRAFAVLIIFTGILLALQIGHFGNLTGMVILGSTAEDSFAEGISNITITSLSVAKEQDNPSVAAALVVVIGLIVLIFAAKYILSHHKHVMHHEPDRKGRKFIKLDLK